MVASAYKGQLIFMIEQNTNYREYIVSELWFAKRREAFKIKGLSCEACGVQERLHVHHGTYERLGTEEMGDLFILCKPCHKGLHLQFKANKYLKSDHNLMLFTKTFINEHSGKTTYKSLATLGGYQQSKWQKKQRQRLTDGKVSQKKEWEALEVKRALLESLCTRHGFSNCLICNQ